MAPISTPSRHRLLNAGRQAIHICIAAAVLGFLVNALRPQGLALIRLEAPSASTAESGNSAGPQPIEPDAALEELNKGNAVFIDARSEPDYRAGHIITARNLPEKTLDVWMPAFFNSTPPETPLIIYCSDPRCHLAERLAGKLYEFGYTHTRILAAGWVGWQASGYPIAGDPAFNNDQYLNQAPDCSTGECRDEQTASAGIAQSTE